MVLTDILDVAGVEVRRGDDAEVAICCPFCEERGETEDKRFRLGINVQKGMAHCFNCDWRGRGVMYVARQLCKAFDIPFNIRKRALLADDVPEKKKPKLTGLPREYESFGRDEADPIGRKALDYLRSRQVSLKQIVDHQIGYAACGDMAWRILFPVFGRDGKTYGCVGRAINPAMKPKYLNTPGLKLLWNAQEDGRTAVVAEGIMDALRVEKALLRTHGMVAVARLGSAITSFQLDQLKEYEKIIVLPDSDMAGLHGAQELCGRCASRGIETWVCIPQKLDGSDPGDMTEDEIMDCLHGAVQWGSMTPRRLREAGLR